MINRILIALLALCLMGVLAGGWLLLDQPVKRFKIEGQLSISEQTQVQQRLRAVGDLQRGMLTTDIDRLRQELGLIDWAHEVAIRRQWPDTLVIQLQRLIPMARWGEDQYLTTTGAVVSLPDAIPDLPDFRVRLSNSEDALRTNRLVEQLTSRYGLKIEALEQNRQGEWEVFFAKGFSVRLGSEQVDSRVKKFVGMYGAILSDAQQPIEYVDLRYSSGAAVRYGAAEIMVADTNTIRTGERHGG